MSNPWTSPKNINRLSIHNKPLHCISAETMESLTEMQGGYFTAVSDGHPLYKAVSENWGDFLVVFQNKLYYAFRDTVNDATVVRMYNVTDSNGDINDNLADNPGWIVMNLKDICVNVEDSTFIRWRFKNSSRERTMDFRINQVDTLPSITDDIVGQIFWATGGPENIGSVGIYNTNDKWEAVALNIYNGTEKSKRKIYDPGVYLCENTRYVRLDFDENQPAFLKFQVKYMAITSADADPDYKLSLFAYGRYDNNGKWVESKGTQENWQVDYPHCVITEVTWPKHISTDIVKDGDILPDDLSSVYIPSDLTGHDIVNSVLRDDYGHVIKYSLMSKVNLRYRWEEI